MKTKTTLKDLLTVVIVTLSLLSGFNTKAQTYVYNEAGNSGMFFESTNGAEVSNPVSDAVNSSANVAYSGTEDPFPWLEIQYFPNYTPVTGDKLYFSAYNPNAASGAQIQFNDGAFFGGNVTYIADSNTGWVEYSIALDDEIGNELTKIILYPDSGSPVGVYIDNIYFGQTSVLSNTPSTTYFFQDATVTGSIFHNGASEVANPLSDAINSSSTVIQTNGGATFQETQFFEFSYNVQAGDKFFISFYNPNGATNFQIRMDLSSTGTFTQITGGDPAHDANTSSGWTEVSLDLSAYAGENITKIHIYAAAGQDVAIGYDNIYIANNSVLSTETLVKNVDAIFIDNNGFINLTNLKSKATLYVFDLKGSLILEENIDSNKTLKSLNEKGLYFVKIKTDLGFSNHKLLFH